MIASAKKFVVWKGKAFVSLAAGISFLWGGENACSAFPGKREAVVRLALLDLPVLGRKGQPQ